MPKPKFLSELPPSGVGKYERGIHPAHQPMLKAMNANPGMWMVVRECTSKQAAARLRSIIANGKAKAFEEGRYEATTRGTTVLARKLVN